MMTIPPPDGSRDRRIEDLSNLYVIHPVARFLLPLAVRRGVSANLVSVLGFGFGLLAMAAFVGLPGWRGAMLGLAFAACWLVADGLDGMIARATGTASRTGRILDGVCDHGVFIMIYVGLALSIGTVAGWALAISAGMAHTVQSALYEGERSRFHRRLTLRPAPPRAGHVPLYDAVATAADRWGGRLDALLAGPAGAGIAIDYARCAVPSMRAMALLSANVRVAAIALAVLVRTPALFWWIELVPLALVTLATMAWQRHVERQVVDRFGIRADTPAVPEMGVGLRRGA
ncbi:CDP-alcohol phosphatidyltransferase family protein [Sphingomonas bacterium]|uniref:CDP-alcohol phosphatidyltransferase family protein n=1 Tax=Sphingomonas bacterium TaxID=1895847 RepID=UPI0015763794|nr:CDP-alcohol phosphatidyltransferase family protein [Sphingomonas bacterium]